MSASNFKRDIEGSLSSSGLKLSNNLLSKFSDLHSNYRFTAKELAETWKGFSKIRKINDLNDSTYSDFRDAVIQYSSQRDKRSVDSAVVVREGLGRRSVASSFVSPEDTSIDTDAIGLSAVDLIMSKTSVPSPMRNLNEPNAAASSSNTFESAALQSKASSAVVTPGKVETPTPMHPQASTTNINSFLRYGDRKNKGQVVCSYNPQNLSFPSASGSKHISRRCLVQEYSAANNTSSVFRYMFCPNSKRSAALERKWQYLRRAILAHLQSDSNISNESDASPEMNEIDEEVPVGVPQSSPHITIGRICNDAHSGTLNAASLVLEGSKSRSNGARISLDMSNLLSQRESSNTGLDGWSFFPGQMVALQGRNVTGRKMTVDRVVSEGPPPPPLCKTLASKLMDYHHGLDNQNGSSLRVMVACGPFTSQDDLSYQPFLDLLDEVVRVSTSEGGVDLVILMGPFVDLRQPLLADGEKVVLELIDDAEDTSSVRNAKRQKMHVSYETLFTEKISCPLQDLFEQFPNLPTQFVLVPSLDDAVAEPIYPQPPFIDLLRGNEVKIQLPGAEPIQYGSLGLQYIEEAGRGPLPRSSKASLLRRVHYVPNPCTLQLNELTIGLSSTDTLLHLSSEETNANLEPGTRLSRLASHFIRQRSYYPLFPVPCAAGLDLNMDLTKSDLLELPCQPDLLLLPSKLATFCKCIFDKTIVMNPGHLVKGSTGGTFADLLIQPLKRETLESIIDTEDKEVTHDIHDRIRVDIKKI